MKTLVIHPKDESTTFLTDIYKDIPNKKVITSGDYQEVIHEIDRHDRIIMLGHGSPFGLLGVQQFKNKFLIVDYNTAKHLKDKECVFIWCNADQFVKRYNLKGFYSGMFISEVEEGVFCGLPKTTEEEVVTSNTTFSKIVGKIINNNVDKIYEVVKTEYGKLITNNPVANYNHQRLYLN